ncbi:flagellar M-ring protein FliF [Solemya pervernicosa gill symbiont]|uniref:Flagellar M-ring protein n=1 Tax=Solemya pervernicosa gill symbiont TaxID=642797 RepID=A0A1T2LAQ4_9GAMM|nr:flagellar basal-body MS-ring/collar protein FliF [Solemya pervernicosa gill symbiont]OOZ42124.1 flagellar M-ring protein FliF [Solemya pervernicosa gill symbiont]
MDLVEQGQGVAKGMGHLPAWRQIAVMIGLAASIALGGVVVLWSMEPNYTLLYSSLADKDAKQVVDALQAQNIPYKLDQSSGALLVPSSKVHEVRIKLAADGLPKGSGMGFEMLEEEQGFGTSNFIEKARFQRALEGELARSIASINNVRTARIHLAMPKQSVFVRKRQKPSASVLVNLYSGRTLEEGQVASIVHMVASSVPNLESSQVTVVDQNGNLLTKKRRGDALGIDSEQFDYTRRVEDSYVGRIENLLAPVLGVGGVRAQVTAELDFTVTEKTQESFNPDLPAVRSEQVMEDRSAMAAGASGIPGALSNQPPGAGTTNPNAAADGSGGSQGSSSLRTTRNYELDRTISHTKMSVGSIRRLSVAVILDNKRGVDAAGTASNTPFTAEEVARITTLVKDAVGFNPQRGDTVNVVNTPFLVEAAIEALPEVPMLEQPWVQDLIKQGVGAIAVLLLIFVVLKPMMRNLVDKGAEIAKAQADAMRPALAAGMDGDLSGDQLSLTGGAQPQLGGPKLSYDEKLGSVRGMVTQDPKLVAQVVKTWVGDED